MFEQKLMLNHSDFVYYEKTSLALVRNLNRLREIKDDYQAFLYTDFTNTSNALDT